MFTSQEYIDQKTGSEGFGRLEYLQALVTEYQDSQRQENKEQVLANLANFAYDPINYEHFRKLNVVDLFLDALTEDSEKFVEFGIGGICNACLDSSNKQHIIDHGGIPLIIKCLSSTNEETVLSAITSLIYLITPEIKKDITTEEVIQSMTEFAKSPDRRLSNLAQIFLKDYCNIS